MKKRFKVPYTAFKDNQKKIDSIGKRGMLRYNQIFNNNIVADYIISKTFDIKCNSKIVWK